MSESFKVKKTCSINQSYRCLEYIQILLNWWIKALSDFQSMSKLLRCCKYLPDIFYKAFDQNIVSLEPGCLFARQLNLLCQVKCNAMLHYPAEGFSRSLQASLLLSLISTLDRLVLAKRAGPNVKVEKIIPDCSMLWKHACSDKITGIILSDTCTQACAVLRSFKIWMLFGVFSCAMFVYNEIPNI